MEQHLITEHHDSDANDIFGFWIYILSDCLLFATLFATFAVLRHNIYGKPDIIKLSDLSYVFVETIVLLASSFTYGLSMLATYKSKIKNVVFWLVLTFLLGAVFIGMEVNEFIDLSQEGFGWQVNAAMSAFYTLVGTHGLHVSIGLIWIIASVYQLYIFGLNDIMKKRLVYLGLFWAFLDIIWIFVFTIVYLMGALA